MKMKAALFVFLVVFVSFGLTLPLLAGSTHVTTDGIKFSDGTVQTTASAPTWHQIFPAAERFQLVMNDTAVLDKETGLVWEKSPDTTGRNWFSACGYCYNKKVGGLLSKRKGWRLPTIEELASLVDTLQSNPALPAGHPFFGVQSSYYWSSSTYAREPNSIAWCVNFSNGNVYYIDHSEVHRAWCVRGGYGHDAY